MSETKIMRGAKLPAPECPELTLPRFDPPLRIVLVEPRIPPNVGAASRICAALGAPLYLVGKLTFQEDHPARRRAGLDYWQVVEKVRLGSFDDLLAQHPDARFHLFSTGAGRSLFEVSFEAGDFLVFGSEDDGLPKELLKKHAAACVRIPMVRGIRSLNVTNAIGIAAYEAARQLVATAPG